MNVLHHMITTGLVPVFYHDDVETASEIVRACLDGGARCIEFTNRGDQADRVFIELIRRFSDDERLILGVGTVLSPHISAQFIQNGAEFIVSPNFNAEIAVECNRNKIAYCPGCGSVTEVTQALESGVEICKIFPAGEVGGPRFIRSIRGPMPWVSLMPTGGVTPDEENISEWIASGATCLGIGSKLIHKDLIREGQYKELTAKIQDVLEWIAAARTA